jgi:hypothetical protein
MVTDQPIALSRRMEDVDVTKGELERLAIVETLVSGLSADMAEVKADVKILLGRGSAISGAWKLLVWAVPIAISIVAVVR